MYSLFFTQLIQDITYIDEWLRPLLTSTVFSHPVDTPNAIYIQFSPTLLNFSYKYYNNLDYTYLPDYEDNDLYFRTTKDNSASESDPLEIRTITKEDGFLLNTIIDEYFTIDYDTSCIIELKVNSGVYYYNSSTSHNIVENYKLDSNIVVNQFNASIRIPLEIGSCTRTFYYDNSETLHTEEDKEISLQKFFLPKPKELTVWEPLSIDPTRFLDDSPLATTVYTDSVVHQDYYNPENYVAVVNYIPQGVVYMTYKNDKSTVLDKIISQSYLPLPNRGYLPCSNIGINMSNTKLIEVAWGILGLIATNQDELLYSCLTELVYFNNISTATYGLPSLLPREPELSINCLLDGERSVYDNAWLGLAVLRACEYFCNRKIPNNINPPEGVEDLINSIANLLLFTTNIDLGLSVTTVLDSGFTTNTYSYSCSVMTYFFFSDYICVRYSERIHLLLAALETTLNANKVIRPSENNITYVCSMLMYTMHKQTSTLFWQTQLAKAYNVNLLEYEIALSSYVYSLVENPIADLSSKEWDIQDKCSVIGDGLYTIDGSPSLLVTTSYLLSLDGYNLPNLVSKFYTYSRESIHFRDMELARLQKLAPIFLDNDKNEESVIDSIWRGIVEYTYSWYLSYALLKNSLALSKAQGKYLDNWGSSKGLSRKFLQNDKVYKILLESRVGLYSNQFSKLIKYLNAVYTDYEIYENYPNLFTDLSLNINTFEDLAQYLLASPNLGVYTRTLSGVEFIDVNSIGGIIELYLFSHNPQLVKDITDILAVGVKFKTVYIFNVVTYNNNIITYV